MAKVMLIDGSEIAKTCPACKDRGKGDVKLIIRTNRHSKNQFVGCPNWPECFYTEPVPEELIMRASGQPSLF